MGGNGEKWEEMEKNGEKWRKMEENGGRWGIARNCQKYQKCVKFVGNGREIRTTWDKFNILPCSILPIFPQPSKGISRVRGHEGRLFWLTKHSQISMRRHWPKNRPLSAG